MSEVERNTVISGVRNAAGYFRAKVRAKPVDDPDDAPMDFSEFVLWYPELAEHDLEGEWELDDD